MATMEWDYDVGRCKSGYTRAALSKTAATANKNAHTHVDGSRDDATKPAHKQIRMKHMLLEHWQFWVQNAPPPCLGW
jgi:hypothetical protein